MLRTALLGTNTHLVLHPNPHPHLRTVGPQKVQQHTLHHSGIGKPSRKINLREASILTDNKNTPLISVMGLEDRIGDTSTEHHDIWILNDL